MPQPSIRSLPGETGLAATEAIAFELCAFILRRGKTKGRYVIETEVLKEAMALEPFQFEGALELAVERAWIAHGGLTLALRAAGIYAVKMTLDLPR